jgi:hypothetical protein
MADQRMDQMVAKANEIKKLMAEAAQETDPDKAREFADRLMAEGRALEQMGEKMRQEAQVARGVATMQVVLTPEQRKRVFQKHGIQMETLVIQDEGGAMSRGMPSERLEYIESLAMKEAERQKLQAEAEKLVRAELDRAMAEIEAVDNMELTEQLNELKKDPNFMGGLLQKK